MRSFTAQLKDKAFEKIKVWADPTTYNRRARRAVGIRGHVSPFRAETETFVPRYVRRHWGKVSAATRPFTRRVRKQRARIERQMVSYGMAKAR